MVATALGPDLEEDVVAALASAMIIAIKRSLRSLERPDNFSEWILSASHGKMVFVDMGNSYLVVVTNQRLVLNTSLVEIRSTARKIKHRRVSV